MNHMENVARRKAGGPEGWKVCAWRVVGEGRDMVVTGGVPREMKSGPRKGKPTWRDVPTQTVVVTGEEQDAEKERYEAATGHCGDCFGKDESIRRWSAVNGLEVLPCARCCGTGRAHNAEPPQMLNHTLIGARVEWEKDTWTVTGARKPEPFAGRVEFRLLALKGSRKGEEVWTEPGPRFGDVEANNP
jgi:hypothetical protein